MNYSRITGLVTLTASDGSDFHVQGSKLANMLGFDLTEDCNSSGGVLIGSKKVDVRRTQSLFIVSPDIITDVFDSYYLSHASVLARIPIDINPYNTVLNWRNTTGIMTKVHTRNVNSLHLAIVDDHRRVVKFTRPWQVNVQIDVITHKDIIPYAPRLFMANGKQIELPPNLGTDE